MCDLWRKADLWGNPYWNPVRINWQSCSWNTQHLVCSGLIILTEDSGWWWLPSVTACNSGLFHLLIAEESTFKLKKSSEKAVLFQIKKKEAPPAKTIISTGRSMMGKKTLRNRSWIQYMCIKYTHWTGAISVSKRMHPFHRKWWVGKWQQEIHVFTGFFLF